LKENQGAAAIARLIGHLIEEARDGGWGGFGCRYIVQRFAEAFTVPHTVQGTTELAVPKHPKRSDYFAAIQAAHNKYTLRTITITGKHRKYSEKTA
jgi:hypothetical protein